MFPWDADLVSKIYHDNINIRIRRTGSQTGKAICFFSGNGLYFPNDDETFKRVIVSNDRYEFERISISKTISEYYELVVLVRDLYKQWYVTGINYSADDADKTAESLDEMLQGYEVTTVGISAGGYAAVLFGKKLNAKRVFSISGQWRLTVRKEDPFVYRYSTDKKRSYYYDLCNIIDNEFASRVYYFFPAKNKEDIQQNAHVRDLPLNRFALDDDQHGALLRYETFFHVFTIDDKQLQKSRDKHANEMVTAMQLFNELVPVRYRYKYKMTHAFTMIRDSLRVSK